MPTGPACTRDRWFESAFLQRRVTQTRSIPTDLEGLASAWRSLPVGAPLTDVVGDFSRRRGTGLIY